MPDIHCNELRNRTSFHLRRPIVSNTPYVLYESHPSHPGLDRQEDYHCISVVRLDEAAIEFLTSKTKFGTLLDAYSIWQSRMTKHDRNRSYLQPTFNPYKRYGAYLRQCLTLHGHRYLHDETAIAATTTTVPQIIGCFADHVVDMRVEAGPTVFETPPAPGMDRVVSGLKGLNVAARRNALDHSALAGSSWKSSGYENLQRLRSIPGHEPFPPTTSLSSLIKYQQHSSAVRHSSTSASVSPSSASFERCSRSGASPNRARHEPCSSRRTTGYRHYRVRHIACPGRKALLRGQHPPLRNISAIARWYSRIRCLIASPSPDEARSRD
jgi:hypothetical protein